MENGNGDFVGNEDGIRDYPTAPPASPGQRLRDLFRSPTNSDGSSSVFASPLPEVDINELPGCSPALLLSKCSMDRPPSYLESSAAAAAISAKEHFPSTEAEVRAVLEEHYHGSEWYRKKSVDKMEIIRIKPMNAYYYVLDAFTEKRVVVTMNQPFIREYIDGKKNGPVPNKWDVPVKPTVSFAKYSYGVNLPHSDSVVSCPHCDGVGKYLCFKCKGKVVIICTTCHGTGKIDKNVKCGYCKGTGNVCCDACATGTSQCLMCKGHKAIKYWQVVEIAWDCCASEFVTERDDLKAKHLLEVKGWDRLNILTLGDNSQPNELLKDAGIADTTDVMLKSMLLKKKDQELKILETRQRLWEIPVVKVLYKLKDEEGYLYIYGLQRKVYVPKPFRYNVGKGICVCF